MTPPPASSAAPAELRAEYRPSSGGLALLFVLFAGFGAYATWLSLTATPPAWTSVIAGSVIVLGGLGFAAWVVLSVPWRIRIYDEWMVAEWLFERDLIRWDEIALLRSSLVTQQGVPILRFALETEDGRKLGFGEMPNEPKQRPGADPRIGIDELIGGLTEVSAPARYRRAVQRYDGGQPVEFKKFQLSQAGLRAGGQTLSWPMVADIEGNGRFIVVKAVGQERPWRVFEFHELPNTDILPAVFAHARGTGFSAFQGIEQSPALEAAARASKRRRRLFSWLLLPLFVIALNAGIAYASYAFSARANYDRASAAAARGDYAGALREFDAAVQKDPDEVRYYIERGRTHYQMGELDAAASDFQAALRLRPADPQALGLSGMVLHRQSRFGDAIALYNAALEAQPGYGYAYCQRGASYAMLGRREQAREDFLRCRNSGDGRWRAEAELLLRRLGER
jgi:tetratricopeptide (TPR) repeat protein